MIVEKNNNKGMGDKYERKTDNRRTMEKIFAKNTFHRSPIGTTILHNCTKSSYSSQKCPPSKNVHSISFGLKGKKNLMKNAFDGKSRKKTSKSLEDKFGCSFDEDLF